MGQLTEGDVLNAFKVLNAELLLRLERIEPRRKPAHLALDPHGMPFYGKYTGPRVCGGKHERGTSWAYKFACISTVSERRFVLHAMPMSQFDDKVRLIRELLSAAKQSVDVQALYLDREFYSVPCMKELEGSGGRYIMPVRSDAKLIEEMRMYRPLSRVVGTKGCTYYRKVRTVVSRKESIDVQTVFLYRPEGEEDFVFVTNIGVTDENVELLAEDYGRRWGIETGFRVTETVRGRTCSRRHAVRWLLHLISVLLYNLWQLVDALLVHVVEARRRRWGYSITMRAFMRLVREVVEAGGSEAIG